MAFLGIDPKDAKNIGEDLKDVQKARKVTLYLVLIYKHSRLHDTHLDLVTF